MNTNEFYVGQFRIDMRRSQIVNQDAIVSIEPKVLKVLLILAEHQGNVVTHETLLNQVWPNVEVAPNALQRCIAQLRKALGDDAKSQRIITTHPKIGYSLTAEVNWEAEAEKLTQNKALNKWWKAAAAFVVSIITVASVWLYQSQPSLPLSYLTPLTTTDHREFGPSFSPDGRFIAFKRNISQCKNHIWAKDLSNNKEYRLTQEPGVYGSLAWSPDGDQLAFSSVTHCTEERAFRGCSDIQALTFALARNTPQPTRQLLSCKDESYQAVVWLSNDELAFFETQSDKRRVMRLSLPEQTMSELYSAPNRELFALDYSPRLKSLAITQFDAKRNGQLILINPESKNRKSVMLDSPARYKNAARWDIYWHPTRDRLLTARDNSIFEIDTQGKFTEYPLSSLQNVWGPVANPDGSTLAAAMGVVDMDVGSIQWTDSPPNSSTSFKSQTLYRSNVSDEFAQFQPQGQHIAFISQRSGTQQIWLSGSTQPKQISQFPKSAQITSYVWSNDGKLIFVALSGQLHLIDLDGQQQILATPFHVLDVMQRLNNNNLLLAVVSNGQRRLVSYDINNSTTESLYEGSFRWAQLSPQNTLYLSDFDNKFYYLKHGEKINIEAINNLYPRHHFIMRGQALYFNDDKKRLWRFATDHKKVHRFLSSVDKLKSIDDIDPVNQRMLYTQIASVKKELVMFHQ